MTALVASVTRPSRLGLNAFENLDSHDELEAIEALQTKIWHFEPQSVTPRHVLSQRFALVVWYSALFDHADTLVGFSLAFRGERMGSLVSTPI